MHLVSGWVLVTGFLLTLNAYAQSGLRFKNPRQALPLADSLAGRGHHILQFEEAPTSGTVASLESRGIRILGDVPGNGLLVSVGPEADYSISLSDVGGQFAGRLSATDKISPLLEEQEILVVEFHADVYPAVARGLVLNLGIELYENPDLRENHLLIRRPGGFGRERTIPRLAALDEVAYIFPASDELMGGSYVAACAGALTMNGNAGQIVSSYGDGWDGPGRNAAALTYVFGPMTARLPPGSAQAEILRAMNEWSKVIALSWTSATAASSARAVHVLFGAGPHGDSYAFDGPGKVLAHTFYPAPPNPEPIAGDMHLDGDESWRLGANIDLFSVALHELGHALGLGHSDNPNDVLYPYYRIATTLSPGDKAAILSLYAPAGSTSAPAPTPTPVPTTPLVLTVIAPAATTYQATIPLSGTVSGASSPSVTWSSTTGAFGAARVTGSNWTIASIGLSAGLNTLTITAASGTAQVERSVTITRQSSAAAADTTAPQITILVPSATSASTSASSIAVSGTASDNTAVTRVTWQNNTGGSGTTSGTSSWSAAIPVVKGRNSIVIRAYDEAGNYGWRSLIVSK